MDSSSNCSRVVVVRSLASEGADETVFALRALGEDASVDLVTDTASCGARAAAVNVDLIVFEPASHDACANELPSLTALGPPVVVVFRQPDRRETLDAFRHGAADCIQMGPDYEVALPMVALEQIRRGQRHQERRDTERRILELRDYTENIIQHMNSALIVVDESGIVTAANPTAEEILGVEPGQLRGLSADDFFPSQGSEPSLVSQTLARGLPFKGAETVLRRRDGRQVPIGISCSPMVYSGRGTQAVAIFQDLTEIKHLERQVLQSEKMASIGQLAAGVAHEINNPTGFIHSNLHQMTEYLTDLRRVWKKTVELQGAVDRQDLDAAAAVSRDLNELSRELDIDFVYGDFAKAVRESQEGSERIRHIVQDLRDFSHMDTGELEDADMNQCLDSTAGIVWTMMKHSVLLEKDYDRLPSIRCYPMQLKQVFMNLLVNAYQSIETRLADSGETQPGRIQIRTRAGDEGVQVEIEDTGQGIEAQHLGRIFDPFFTTKEVGAGTGLGLSTSYSIVERHGGQITVESEVGTGTTFRVSLPLCAPEPEKG